MDVDDNDSFEEKYLLVAKADNVKHISSLLKAVNFKDVSCSLHYYIIILILNSIVCNFNLFLLNCIFPLSIIITPPN